MLCLCGGALRGGRDQLHGGAAALLPYVSWLDYCRVSVLVAERDATHRMPAVIRALQALPDAEVAAKRAALVQARDAFVLRSRSSPQRPSAAEYILGEACAAARGLRAGNANNRSGGAAAAIRRLSGCFLNVGQM